MFSSFFHSFEKMSFWKLSKNLKLKVVKSIFISFLFPWYCVAGTLVRTINSVVFFPFLILASTTHDTANRTNISPGKEQILSLALVPSSKNSKAKLLTILMGRFQAHYRDYFDAITQRFGPINSILTKC